MPSESLVISIHCSNIARGAPFGGNLPRKLRAGYPYVYAKRASEETALNSLCLSFPGSTTNHKLIHSLNEGSVSLRQNLGVQKSSSKAEMNL